MNKGELFEKILWLASSLFVLLLAFIASVVFLNPSSVGNENFLRNVNLWALVWSLIFLLILVLTVTLARYLIRLSFEYQSARPGSRIKSKLVLTFVIFSLFPALIMAFLAFGLINQNLTTWVSAPSEQLLESSREVADVYYTQTQVRMLALARGLSEHWSQGTPEGPLLLRETQGWGFAGARLVGTGGTTLLEVGSLLDHSFTGDVQQVFEAGSIYRIQRSVDLKPGMVDRGIAGVPFPGGPGLAPGALFLYFRLPESLAFHVSSVQEANQVYQGLKDTLATLRITYLLVLTMTTLGVVFGFVWLGSYIARRLTVPLEALAEGSRELASGNLDHRVEVQAIDELGILVNSFNRMAGELKESRSQLESANLELQDTNVHLDERRRYIETVLQNIATGVLTIDEKGVICTANQAALQMLQRSAGETVGQLIQRIADEELYQDILEMKKRAEVYGTYRSQLTIRRNGGRLYVAATVTANALPLSGEVQYLVVLDDLTELLRAEKFAAWQEVARRLAHEIKNPLTPIQLSAERIQRRFERLRPKLPSGLESDEFQAVLEEASRIISSESRILKNLLSEFSRIARLPMCKPTRVDLHLLIDGTLQRYNGSLEAVRISRDFDSRIHEVMADPEQLQRVFVNLIDNSLDALVSSSERRIDVRTRLNESRKSVTIEFSDNGIGISASDYEQLFLPYFSTKRKGTGLGLAIVRQIVSEHNGYIRAEPNSPAGTRFVMEIPLDWKNLDEGQTADRR